MKKKPLQHIPAHEQLLPTGPNDGAEVAGGSAHQRAKAGTGWQLGMGRRQGTYQLAQARELSEGFGPGLFELAALG